jgi:hypothetical protein|nr:MAG TPA: hypothetical protein [Caudoviricetes sp.]
MNEIVRKNGRTNFGREETKRRHWALARLLCNTTKSIVEAYKEIYSDTFEPGLTEYKISNRAYQVAASQGVKSAIREIQEMQAVEEARLLVWDKRKATKFLLERCNEIDANMMVIRQLRDKMLQEPHATAAQIDMMWKITNSMNDTSRTIREIIKDMNEMYGLTDPKANMQQAVQIIIGGRNPSMPDDTADD